MTLDKTNTSQPWIFRCPICGGGSYDAVYEESHAPFGGPADVLYYRCNQCSVLFTDPNKFTDVK